MPNGTYGGVRGRNYSALLDFSGLFSDIESGHFVVFKELVADSGCSSADRRTEDERPKASKRLEVAAEHCAERGTKAAGGVYGGAGEADSEDVDKGEGKTDNKTAEGAVLSLFGGHAEDNEYEYRGEDDLYKEAGKVVAVYAVHRVGAEAPCDLGVVKYEGACSVVKSAHAPDHSQEA